MNWTKHNALSLIKTTQQCRNRKRKEWNTERNNCKKISLIRGVNRESNPGPHQIQISHSYKNRSKIPNGA